jgi:lipoyl(octanoyl) transferase
VWVGASKITAIGLAVRRGVTMHGFAFNVSPNMAHFNFIVPCGIQNRGVASLETLVGTSVDFSQVSDQVVHYFKNEFGYDKVIEMDYERP